VAVSVGFTDGVTTGAAWILSGVLATPLYKFFMYGLFSGLPMATSFRLGHTADHMKTSAVLPDDPYRKLYGPDDI
jgi:hypothetical protein